MIRMEISHDSIETAAERILNQYLSNDDRPYYRGVENIIYFDGWYGLGASAVLAAIAESARSARSKFDKVIHVDCSKWESMREMQRRIVEELKLDRSVMALFDKQDEDDDFSGVDKSSRAEIADVADLIFQTVKDSRCLVIFHNGSDHEIDLSASGVPSFDWRNKVLWTFRGRFRLDPTITDKVKSAHVFLSACPVSNYWLSSDLLNLVHKEAAQVSHDINPNVTKDCWFYLSHLHYNHDNSMDYDQDSHVSNYWVCDGIIPGDRAWEIGDQLREAMRLESLPTKQKHSSWFEMFSAHQEKKSRWISVTSKSVEIQNILSIPEKATSYFLILEKSDHPTALPTHLFEQASKLRVLRLSWCTFSFACPPFICCSNLRFIFIDSCKDEAVELSGEADDKQEREWAFLQSLWVLDIRGTSWDWILSPSQMKLMIELRELNLRAAGASRCILDVTKLELTWLCNLRKLRVIDSSTFLTALAQDPFIGMQNLELLDLSGNSAIEVLPNLSEASRLKVLILDGCDGLQHIEPDALSTSLESFSFDGFGSASGWKSSLQIPEKEARPRARDNQELPKISKISLEGCARLKSVFLRGLPNLKELNLSETAIQALDLEAMQVRQLERLFLIGCKNLRRVQWLDARNPPLELLHVDTRGKAGRSMDGDCQQSHSYSQQNFTRVVATDARFLRGFVVFGSTNFHLHLSSTVSSRQLPGTKEMEISSSDELGLVPALGLPFLYSDVLGKVVKEDNGEDCSMQARTQLVPSERHIELAKGDYNWEVKSGMAFLMNNAKSMHVHDSSSITVVSPENTDDDWRRFTNLEWCRVERCPKMRTIFLVDSSYMSTSSFKSLKIFWASHLLAAHCIWSREFSFDTYSTATAPAAFSQLRYIHLHSCPRLTFVLPWSFPTMASLETIHITYCGELRQIFPEGQTYRGKRATNIEFPSLRNIHLHELPMLQHICETKMSAPVLETIKLRGCWSLRQLPAIHAGRPHDKLLETVVDCEKDWWDKLQWDGLEESRHLFSPRHSCYYKKSIPRGSVLR